MASRSLEGEKRYLLERYGLTGLQYATLAAVPIYALAAIRRGQFSIRSLVRYSWGVPLTGGLAGTATGYTITSRESDASVAARTVDMRMDKRQVRRDDMFLVGSVVGGLLVPALFLRRAGLINGLLGGAGLGGAGGLVTNLVQDEGGLENALSREGSKAIEAGRDLADAAKARGRELAHKGEAAASDARERGREVVDKAK